VQLLWLQSLGMVGADVQHYCRLCLDAHIEMIASANLWLVFSAQHLRGEHRIVQR